jgi:hypothetical protein
MLALQAAGAISIFANLMQEFVNIKVSRQARLPLEFFKGHIRLDALQFGATQQVIACFLGLPFTLCPNQIIHYPGSFHWVSTSGLSGTEQA